MSEDKQIMEQDIQIQQKVSEGNSVALNPITKAKNVKISSLNGNIPDGVENVGELIDNLGTLAFEDSIEIPAATTTSYGVTKLSNSVTDTENTNTAATTAAVSKVAAESVKNTGSQEIDGSLNVKDTLKVGGATLSYSSTKYGEDILEVNI